MRTMSDSCRARLTEPWEECVLYVYDDKVPKRLNPKTARREYPEWDGGTVRGTLTVGLGHTDAAGAPKIVQGMRITRAEADAIFAADIAPCEEKVASLLKKPVTQHQYDALVDTYFNCPRAAVAAIALINADNTRAVPAKLLQYTYSKGEHMDGLTHRRAAEIAWFNTPDHVDGPLPPHEDAIYSPKAERNPPPKPASQSKVIAASRTIVAGGVGSAIAAVQAANEAAAPIEEARGHLVELGLFDALASVAHSPAFWGAVTIVTVALGVFIECDRRSKLTNDHV